MIRHALNRLFGKKVIKETVLQQAQKNKSIVYGAQALNRQLFIRAMERQTNDYDVFSKHPKKSARQLEKKLDKKFGGDYFYTKPAMHKGTYKVMEHNKKENVADYTKTPQPKPRTVKINGVQYAHISETEKDKRSSLRDPEFAFRHKKDREDLNRIIITKKFRKL